MMVIDDINKTIVLESVRERDIDLLLLEEFNVNHEFCSFFLKLMNTSDNIVIDSRAVHSITDNIYGESDLLLSCKTKTDDIMILIENKIDAEAQPEQAKRYEIRKNKLAEKFKCKVLECIVAPNHYLVSNNEARKYDNMISYEDIREYFLLSESIRNNYKAEVLNLAISQERRGYTAIKDEVVTTFWKDYWSLLSETIPEAFMKCPVCVPTNSDWPIIKFDWFPKNCFIYHKLSRGIIDFQTNLDAEELQKVICKHHNDNIKIVKTGKTTSLRVNVPIIDKTQNFELQKGKILEAFSVIKLFQEKLV